MLDNPEKRIWYDDSEIVYTSSRSEAERRCTAIADRNEGRGEGRCTLKGVVRSKTGKTYRCIFEREIDE
jgi:hypothetical protein